jgi:hypothetical protein
MQMKLLSFLKISLLSNLLFAQVTLTQEQVINISNKIDSLQTLDSLNKSIILDYKDMVKDYDSKISIDSLTIVELESQIKTHEETVGLLEKKVKLVKSRWYENKYLWLIAGAVPSYYIGKIVEKVD